MPKILSSWSMELSPLFLTYPWIWAIVALLGGLFLIGMLFRRFGWAFFIAGALGLTALIIFVLLFDGDYLDAALIAMVSLLPLFVYLALPKRKKEEEAEEEQA